MGFSGPCGHPQEWIQRIALAGSMRVSPALCEDRDHLLAGDICDGTEAWVCANVEIEVVIHLIHEAKYLQFLNSSHHLRDCFHRSDVISRWDHTQGGHVGAKELCFAHSYVAPVLARHGSTFKKGIINVGDILGVVHCMTRIAPSTVE